MADDPNIPTEIYRDDVMVNLPEESLAPQIRQNDQTLIQKIREEFEEPAVVIFGHALLIIFGVLILSLLGWLIDKAHISDLAKEVLHTIDEYLMIFAFVILGFSFIIKIATIVLGSIRRR